MYSERRRSRGTRCGTIGGFKRRLHTTSHVAVIPRSTVGVTRTFGSSSSAISRQNSDGGSRAAGRGWHNGSNLDANVVLADFAGSAIGVAVAAEFRSGQNNHRFRRGARYGGLDGLDGDRGGRAGRGGLNGRDFVLAHTVYAGLVDAAVGIAGTGRFGRWCGRRSRRLSWSEFVLAHTVYAGLVDAAVGIACTRGFRSWCGRRDRRLSWSDFVLARTADTGLADSTIGVAGTSRFRRWSWWRHGRPSRGDFVLTDPRIASLICGAVRVAGTRGFGRREDFCRGRRWWRHGLRVSRCNCDRCGTGGGTSRNSLYFDANVVFAGGGSGESTFAVVVTGTSQQIGHRRSRGGRQSRWRGRRTWCSSRSRQSWKIFHHGG